VTVNLPLGAGAAASQDLPVRALIVDDQAPFRTAARSLIRLLRGWEVVGEAATGEDALAWFVGRGPVDPVPDVVLMDINLPGISGIEATRRITAAVPGTAVVLVSTYAEQDLPEDAGRCGAIAYVRKDDLTPRLLRALLGGS
jgi:two-component system invasion response regulator UvrY